MDYIFFCKSIYQNIYCLSEIQTELGILYSIWQPYLWAENVAGPLDEAESDGEKPRLLPASVSMSSAWLITQQLDGCLVPNQHSAMCKAQVVGLEELGETKQNWLGSGSLMNNGADKDWDPASGQAFIYPQIWERMQSRAQ